ncbi:MAG: hypothetical protein EPO20_21560 [Betaproteobacteria bacterium]|nr:MAG: hypothetical protein EPO20_21560 [Betaproteobacteria bacterium]
MAHRVLLAAPHDVILDVQPALAKCLELSAAETLDEAITRLHADKPEMLLVCYAFDNVRPFRLLQYLQLEWQGPKMPIMLIRAVPVSTGKAEEAEIFEAYSSLGVLHFFNLWNQIAQHGREVALRRLQHAVQSILPT